MKLNSEEKLKSELRTYKKYFFVSLPFALFGVFIIFAFIIAIWEFIVPGQKVSLPKNVTTLKEFTEIMPEPEKISLINISENSYLVVTGGIRRPFPSGNPVYIFDKGGKIISWSNDSGDAGDEHPYHKYFIKPDSSSEISMEEALKITSENDNVKVQ